MFARFAVHDRQTFAVRIWVELLNGGINLARLGFQLVGLRGGGGVFSFRYDLHF